MKFWIARSQLRALNREIWILGSESWALNCRIWIVGSESWALNLGLWITGTESSARWQVGCRANQILSDPWVHSTMKHSEARTQRLSMSACQAVWMENSVNFISKRSDPRKEKFYLLFVQAIHESMLIIVIDFDHWIVFIGLWSLGCVHWMIWLISAQEFVSL